MDNVTQFNMKYTWGVCLIATLGGLLFGYDWVVISGAKPFYETYFNLTTPYQIGWAMSSALVGCLFGSLLSGIISDKFGRKKLLILSGFLFAITSIGTALSNCFTLFVSARLLGGVAIGLASTLAPMYIAELSPAPLRGRFVSVNQLAIVIGILLAQTVNWLIAEAVPIGATAGQILQSWNGQSGWRWMFGATTFPAIFFFVMMFLVPESPRWLVKNGRKEDAIRVLEKVANKEYAKSTVTEIDQTLINEIKKVNFRDLLDPRMRKILYVGIVLAIFQQWCGINVILYYAQEVFSAAGYEISDLLLNIVITGTVMLVFTFVAINTVDKFGRRILLLIGSAGLAVIYLFIGAGYFTGSKGVYMLFLTMLAIAFYSFSLAPVVWVLLAEIFPNRIRGAAMAIGTFALWAGCWSLTYTFPILNTVFGSAYTFWVYAAICTAGFIFILKKVPETKGKTLEEIEHAFGV